MALQIGDTTVIDDNKNIVSGTPSVQGTIVTSTVGMSVPSGTTAQRPASPTTGMIFFDTDVGKIVVYNGTDWV